MLSVGLDCESKPFSPGCKAPKLACVAIGDADEQIVLHHTDWLTEVSELLLNPEIRIVGHNIGFDMVLLCNEEPMLIPVIFDAYEQGRISCTQCRQKLCDIAGGIYRGFEDIEGQNTKLNYSLADVTLRHLGEVLDKDEYQLKYGELIPLPLSAWPKGAVDYVKKDVSAAVRVWHKQEVNAFYLQDEQRQVRASFWLQLMVAWGIRTDAEGVRLLAERTKRDYDLIAKDLTAVGLLWPAKKVKGVWKASRNTKAVKARVAEVYAQLGKPVPLTDGGKSGNKAPCTDRVTCEESGDAILISYSKLSSLGTVLSKDIPMLSLGIHYPIHTTIEDILETARTSSRKPNIQNNKRAGGIRECFVPRCLGCGRVHTAEDVRRQWCLGCDLPITIFWSCDYGGLELCTLAQACVSLLGKSKLAEALNAGIDPHLVIASQILNRPYDELKAIKKAGAGPECQARLALCHCRYCIISNARQVGKVLNFGCPGGLGAEALVFFALNNYDVHLTVAQAQKLKKVWLETWPEMRLYFAWISRQTDKPFPQIQQLFSGRYRGNVRYTEACNTVFQGLGADISKSAGWLIFRAMYDPTQGSILYRSRCVNFIHDEFVGESLITHGHECAMEVRRLMLEAARPWLPDVKIDVEPALMHRFSKEAGPKYDENKRLIPWGS